MGDPFTQGITEITRDYIKCNMPPDTTEVVITEGVKSIACCAFWNCTCIKSVVVPMSVERIGSWAFSDCISLSIVVIYKGVEHIARDTFCGCTSLKTVTVLGV